MAKRKNAAARRRAREARLKRAESLRIAERGPDGRTVRVRNRESQRVKPNEAQARLKALMNGLAGDPNDWIDRCEADQVLEPRQAEALRRFRSWGKAFNRIWGTPREAPDILMTLMPHSGSGSETDEEAAARIKTGYADTLNALRDAGKREAEVVERHINERGMPLSGSVERIRRGANALADWFGL